MFAAKGIVSIGGGHRMKLVTAALFCAMRSRCKINDRCKLLEIRRGNELDLDFSTRGKPRNLISSKFNIALKRQGTSRGQSRDGLCNSLIMRGGNDLDLDYSVGRRLRLKASARQKKYVELNSRR